MNFFKIGDILIDTRDEDRYTVVEPNSNSFFENHLLVKTISSKANPQNIGIKLFVPQDKVRLEKPRDKSHPLTRIFK